MHLPAAAQVVGLNEADVSNLLPKSHSFIDIVNNYYRVNQAYGFNDFFGTAEVVNNLQNARQQCLHFQEVHQAHQATYGELQARGPLLRFNVDVQIARQATELQAYHRRIEAYHISQARRGWGL